MNELPPRMMTLPEAEAEINWLEATLRELKAFAKVLRRRDKADAAADAPKDPLFNVVEKPEK